MAGGWGRQPRRDGIDDRSACARHVVVLDGWHRDGRRRDATQAAGHTGRRGYEGGRRLLSTVGDGRRGERWSTKAGPARSHAGRAEAPCHEDEARRGGGAEYHDLHGNDGQGYIHLRQEAETRIVQA